MNEDYILKTVIISSNHINSDFLAALDDRDIVEYVYGGFSIPLDHYYIKQQLKDQDGWLNKFEKEIKDLLSLVKKLEEECHGSNCYYLLFHPDGRIYPDLPVYEN